MTTTNPRHRKAIANHIAIAAAEAGLTHVDLAKLLGIGTSGISRRLNGETGWPAEDLATIATAIGLDIPWWLSPHTTAVTGKDPSL